MTLNLVRGANDHSKSHQLNLLAYASQHSKYPVTDGGADPEGWVEALVNFGAGDDYGWTTTSTMASALHTAAAQRARRASRSACSSISDATRG